MSEEILINVTPPETRVAIVENGVIQEIIIERTRQLGLVGNIYKGTVCRVLPGMQAAFVDVGLERTAFLHLSDLSSQELANNDSENIEHYLHENQQIIVQVTKDPISSKGARLTTELSIPSRYQVYMPYALKGGVSQRIEHEPERQRLRAFQDSFQEKHKSGGFIARTAAECIDETVLESDMLFLLQLWDSIQEKILLAEPKALIHYDLPLSIRTLRDLYTENIEKVKVDSRLTYQRLVKFAEEFVPDILPIIEHYTRERPLFDIYNIEDEIEKA